MSIKPLALYIHWPFCASKCPYCDFNAHVREGGVDQTQWLPAYQADMRYWRKKTGERTITSIFFGGGTPSLMRPETVAGIIDEAQELWSFAADCEITLEANPTSSEAHQFKSFKSAGVNRLSIGVQALNDTDLKQLGRNHGAQEAFDAIAIAAQCFNRFSFDLIYARSKQTLDEWEAELKTALSLSSGHLSLYQLTIEPGTQFKTLHQSGRLTIPDDDLAVDFYTLTQDVCDAAGLPAYEISNHAMAGHESNHNMTYWTGGDYLGIGAGAHGRITLKEGRLATLSHHAPEIWLQRVHAHGTGVNRETLLDNKAQVQERLMLGLRIDAGVAMADVSAVLNTTKLDILKDEGLLHHDRDRLRVTKRGRLLLNSIVATLVNG